MNNVQRLEIEQNFYTDALVLLTCRPKDVSSHVDKLAKQYNISKEAVYYRIRTKYGDKLANIRMKYRLPSREVLLQTVRMCEQSEQVQERLGLTHWEFIGIYDKILGVSTFSQAKFMAIREMEIVRYNPSIKDNQSLIFGMRLGDGSYDPKRKALRIEHSYKQKPWLEQKVQMMKSAYPFVATEIKDRERTFGMTAFWYSRKLQGSAITYNEVAKIDMARLINPLGIFILFLDDGNCGTYGHSSVLGFATENAEIGSTLVQNLKTYGFIFTQEHKNMITLKRRAEIQTFLNEMILPFSAFIPDAMRYKTVLKV